MSLEGWPLISSHPFLLIEESKRDEDAFGVFLSRSSGLRLCISTFPFALLDISWNGTNASTGFLGLRSPVINASMSATFMANPVGCSEKYTVLSLCYMPSLPGTLLTTQERQLGLDFRLLFSRWITMRRAIDCTAEKMLVVAQYMPTAEGKVSSAIVDSATGSNTSIIGIWLAWSGL